MSVEARAQRLSQVELRRTARKLLADSDPETVVMMLLRTIRSRDDIEESIQVGYESSAKMREDLHELLLDQEHIEIARAIEREARHPRPQGRQELTYAGGLRKAARIARGWR